MFIYARAALNAIVFKRYIGFVTTNKRESSSDLRNIKWNLIFGGVLFLTAVYTLYLSLIASNYDQFRESFPVSLWLLFYSLVLGSSIIFIGKKEGK